MRYSVIIPIYNAEKTLNTCLNSLAEQIRTDVEILMINDGSTDSSGQICKSFADQFQQFRYFYQNNSGVSHARNVGLSASKGTYILFVDSDDYVEKNFFSVLDQLTADPEVDLTMFGVRFFGMRNFDATAQPGAWNGLDASRTLCEWMRKQLLNSLWSKIYKRSIIQQNHLLFDETLSIGEDLAFIFSYALSAEKVACDTSVLYHVREENMQSLSRKKIESLPEKMMRVDAIMREALDHAEIERGKKQLFQAALARNYYRSAYSASKQWKTEPDSCKRRKEIRAICSQFSKERVSPRNLENLLISIPVRTGQSWLIDFMIQLR